MKRLVAGVVLAGLVAAAGPAAEISIKIKNGLSLFLPNDYDRGMRGTYDYQRAGLDRAAGAYQPFSIASDFAGEIIIFPWPRFGIGLGAGRLQASAANSLSYADLGFAIRETWEPDLSAVPLTVNLHFSVPVGRSLRLAAFVGAGYYLSTFRVKNSRASDFFSYEETRTFDFKKNQFGLQGGLGLELEIGSHFALCAEIDGRYVDLWEARGEWSEEVSWFRGRSRISGRNASLWIFERNVSGTATPQAALGENAPADPSFRDVRRGTIPLTGITAAAGIKFVF